MTTIYIPSGIFSSEFNEQISGLLSKLLSLTGKHVIIGDFYFRINNPTNTHAAKFKALTEQFNLIQHVSIPAHDAGNTLDLALTRDGLSVSSIFTDHSVKSDHSAVLFTISYTSPRVVIKSITYRKWKYWFIICASWYIGRIRGFRISEYRHCRPDLQYNSSGYYRQPCTAEVTNRYNESWWTIVHCRTIPRETTSA